MVDLRAARVLALLAAALAVIWLGGCVRPKLRGPDVVQMPTAPPPNDTVAPAPVPAPAPAPAATTEPEASAEPLKVKVVSPTEGQVVSPGKLVVRIEVVTDAEPGKGKASEPAKSAPAPAKAPAEPTKGGAPPPPAAGGSSLVGTALLIIDSGTPLEVKTGEDVTLADVKPGPHLLRVVPTGDHGLAVEPGWLQVRAFTVGDKPLPVTDYDAQKPVLTVGQPFGTAKTLPGGAVMFDFCIDNATIGENATQLKWTVDGGEAQSLYGYPPEEPQDLGKLTPGHHKLIVWLDDKGKTPENHGLTRVEREFDVAAEPARG